jgi:hypothetical protein
MRRHLILILPTLFVIASCSKMQLPGEYHSSRPSYYDYAVMRLHGIHSCMYAFHSKLSLHPDSSFNYTTCGNIMAGHWKVLKDSLFLYVTANRWRIDSFNKFGFKGEFAKVSLKPYTFKIKGRELFTAYSSKQGYLIDCMKKQ